jgi:hypothetical protein
MQAKSGSRKEKNGANEPWNAVDSGAVAQMAKSYHRQTIIDQFHLRNCARTFSYHSTLCYI